MPTAKNYGKFFTIQRTLLCFTWMKVMVMQQTRFFRTMSSMDDALFSGMGKGISIRQTIILGVGCGIVLLAILYTRGENPFLFPLVIIPIILGVMRTKTMTADAYIMTVLSFATSGGSTKRIKATRRVVNAKRVPSMRMGLKPEEIKSSAVVNTIRKIPVIDTAKPVRLNITIQGPDGSQYSNKFVSVYIDGTRVAAVSTDGTGRLAITVVPKKLGMKKLRVMPKDGDEPLLDGMVEFVDE